MTDMTDIMTTPDVGRETADKMSVITVNFELGSIIDKVQVDGDGGVPKFFRDMAVFAKKDNVKSVIVLTINEDDHVDWVHMAASDHHLALAALCLDDIKDDLKNHIFRDMEEEEA